MRSGICFGFQMGSYPRFDCFQPQDQHHSTSVVQLANQYVLLCKHSLCMALHLFRIFFFRAQWVLVWYELATMASKCCRPFDAVILTVVEETSSEERTTHPASCHYGAVKFDVTLKWPFSRYPVNKCNCSICVCMGYLVVYPARRDVVFT
ncbi:hypothetical protein B0O99DRAFT_604554 [Bisporella sp. PMI_857]|nr:hypothetical protein B0O99DRAFT_604554 [Bisporella sp. PMI_857]